MCGLKYCNQCEQKNARKLKLGVTVPVNDEQIEYWNGDAGEIWVRQQAIMDATLQPITEVLLQQVQGQAGENALDVGCGCGDTSLALAQRGLSVTGVDVSEPMLARAQSRATEVGGAKFILADAATHGFESEFDVVLSRFGVMFFDDPVAAFVNLRSAARSGGRLCFVCWQSPKSNSWVSLPMQAVKDLVPPMDPPDPLAPGPFAFADSNRLQRILTDAGWNDVEIDSSPWSIKLGDTTEQAAHFVTEIGPTARLLKELPELAEQIDYALLAALEPHCGEQGVVLDAACWLVRTSAT